MQIDYDMEWLESQRFEMVLGPDNEGSAEELCRITGFKGIGSSRVAFTATDPRGTAFVLKFAIPQLAFYIRELPVFCRTPQRDINRVNQKLLKLVGDPLVDLLVTEYDELYSRMFNSLREFNVSSVSALRSDDSRFQLMIEFVLRTPGFRYRVEDWMTAATEGPKDTEWAEAILKSIDRVPRMDPDLHPEELLGNPFYVWAGAVMEGLFRNEDFPAVISFLRDNFGSLRPGSRADLWVDQCFAIVNLLQNLVDSPGVAQFVKFYDFCDRMTTAEMHLQPLQLILVVATSAGTAFHAPFVISNISYQG
jgi:hypothetical protein